ncbi:MAG: glycosyl hydrolase [Candidatus Kapaibacterium sp.]|nr:MAG: glycosyl hydrolase [Candidatus Kapabacteria bacterium]
MKYLVRRSASLLVCTYLYFCVYSLSPLFAQSSSQKEFPSEPAQKLAFDGLKLRAIGPAITSGRISSIAVHPANKSTWYVAAASGGVWKTVNSGISWSPIFESEASYSIGCVSIDPANPHTIWVGTGENNSQRSVGYGDGVYRSDDGGASWKNVGLKTSEHIARIIIDPRNSNVVYVAAQGPLWAAGGERGLYKTTDGGKTWTQSLKISENTGVSDIVYDPRNPDVLYATAYQRRRHAWTLIDGGPESTIYKSTDAGATWNKIESGLPSGQMGRIGLAISPVNPDILFATVEGANKKGGIFRSVNRGATWEKRNPYDVTAMYYATIYADPKDVDRMYVMNFQIMVSDDGGTTLKALGTKAKHVDNHAMWINPENPHHYLVGCDGGLYETFDKGAQWRHTTNLPITQFYRVSVDNTTPFYYVYGGTQDNYSLGGPSRTISASGPNNYDWFTTQGGDGFKSQIDPENPNIVYAQFQHGGLTRYDKKSGENLGIKPIEGKGEEVLRWNWDAPLIISPHSPSRLYFAANKLFRSDDRGNTWKLVSPDLSRRLDRDKLPVMGKIQPADAVAKHASTALYGNISALAESPKKEGFIVVGTDDGLVQITDDGGKNWRKIEPVGGVSDKAYVSALFCSQHDANVIYVAYDNHKNGDFKPYLFKSNDAGKTWNALKGNLPENGMVLAIAEDHVAPNLLFVGTEFGAFASVNGGAAWKQLKGNFPTIPVRDLAIQKRENDLALASFGRGFYILDDYTPLRALAQSKFDVSKEASIFPIKDALCYVESTPYGDRGKGFLGETFYIAENAPFGAVFTVYVKDALKTKKQVRADAEKGGSTKYPSGEELRAEEEEDAPSYFATVTDVSGNVIRRLNVSNSAGLQRVVWNLRYADQTPIAQHQAEEAEYGGARVLPGEYKVFLSKRVNGVTTSITEPVSFNVVPLNNTTLPATDRKALVAFQQKVANLQRALSGALDVANSTKSRLTNIKKALGETMSADAPKLRDEATSLESRMNTLLRGLRGDSFLASRNEGTPPSIQERVNNIVYEQYSSTSAPPQTHVDSYAVAAQEFEQELAKLKAIVEIEIPRIEKAMEAAQAPYTPGRVPEWKEK